jgi:hypothetical protein
MRRKGICRIWDWPLFVAIFLRINLFISAGGDFRKQGCANFTLKKREAFKLDASEKPLSCPSINFYWDLGKLKARAEESIAPKSMNGCFRVGIGWMLQEFRRKSKEIGRQRRPRASNIPRNHFFAKIKVLWTWTHRLF